MKVKVGDKVVVAGEYGRREVVLVSDNRVWLNGRTGWVDAKYIIDRR